MNAAEHDLLMWLAREDFSQYGECHGKTLDSLIDKGLAQVLQGREHQHGFIAKGDGPMYRAVVVTDAGREALVSAGNTSQQRTD